MHKFRLCSASMEIWDTIIFFFWTQGFKSGPFQPFGNLSPLISIWGKGVLQNIPGSNMVLYPKHCLCVPLISPFGVQEDPGAKKEASKAHSLHRSILHLSEGKHQFGLFRNRMGIVTSLIFSCGSKNGSSQLGLS